MYKFTLSPANRCQISKQRPAVHTAHTDHSEGPAHSALLRLSPSDNCQLRNITVYSLQIGIKVIQLAGVHKHKSQRKKDYIYFIDWVLLTSILLVLNTVSLTVIQLFSGTCYPSSLMLHHIQSAWIKTSFDPAEAVR